MKLLALIAKEWRLLLRDKIGLLILFILPMCLVTFLSMTQGRSSSEQSFKVIVLNQDRGKMANSIIKALKKNGKFSITQKNSRTRTQLANAKKEVAKGVYRALLVIPRYTTSSVNAYAKQLARRRVSSSRQAKQLNLYLDPGMDAGIASSLKLSVQYILKNIEFEYLNRFVVKSMRLSNKKFDKDLFTVKSRYPTMTATTDKPNSVQQNVPAWSLFGMFFIVIPLAGAMVRERSSGVMQRLKVAPVGPATILAGRVISFMLLNLLQLILMLGVGVYVLPHFGLPTLNLFDNFGLVILVGVFASLAATGFGLLIGTWVTTYQQATVLGPFIIIILAAIGGIFVPQYLMPQGLTTISQLSPMYWAQSAFLDIFVRHADVSVLLPQLAKLFTFFVITVLLSLPPITRFMPS